MVIRLKKAKKLFYNPFMNIFLLFWWSVTKEYLNDSFE